MLVSHTFMLLLLFYFVCSNVIPSHIVLLILNQMTFLVNQLELIMNKNEAKKYLDNIMIAYGVNQAEIASRINVNRQYINAVYNGRKELSSKSIHSLEQEFPKVNREVSSPVVAIPYGNNIIHIDKFLLPKGDHNWEFIPVSGNSMSPEYHDSDKILIDKSDNKFTDGKIYAFTVNNTSYIRLINISPNQIKCIPLNKEFDTFYLNSDEGVNVLGVVSTKIRL